MNKTYQTITDTIIKRIEESGKLPWSQPWRNGEAPMSIVGRRYRGINALILAWVRMDKGYTSNRWLTFNRAVEMDGRVTPGEKGTKVILWKPGKEERDPETGKVRKSMFLTSYTLFNLDQTTGVNFTEKEYPAIDMDTLDDAEAIVASYLARDDAPSFQEIDDAAWYMPSTHTINMPPRPLWDGKAEQWYPAMFHEMSHSTAGHLNRKGEGGFSRDSYGKEELVAEMGAAFLCAEASIENHTDMSAAYVQGWLTAVKEDATLLIKAASEAQKAVDYILGTTFDSDTE